MKDKFLLGLLDQAARLAGQRIDPSRLPDVEKMLELEGEGCTPISVFAEGWQSAGLGGHPQRLVCPTPVDLPFVGWQTEKGWFLARFRSGSNIWTGEYANGDKLELSQLDGVECISLPRKSAPDSVAMDAFSLVWRAVKEHRAVFLDAILATAVASMLALAISLYSMQIYDRVIPNQGYQTLWVLTVGVVLAIGFEFVLRLVRGKTVDKVSSAIDHKLSDWLFGRMLGIRMEHRPASVGTLAAQVKGFETVRAAFTSTSVFVLVDVPFALFFVVIIGLVGGWLIVVPIIFLPIALMAGLIFQRSIERHSRLNLAGANRKAGLLVEAVDGAESLKANSAEWKMRSRWRHLIHEVSESDEKMRTLSLHSQHLTVAAQQLSYIALVALGAYLVAENQLTMGGLLACTIISNRAMSPIVQLPGVLVQWAHAKAALEGLDRIIVLANEQDEEGRALVPEVLDSRYRFERVRFSYGMSNRLALDVEKLEIRPGERVGVLGAIGSGKSTLLKLASGMYRPQEGKVFIGELDMALLLPSVVRETAGYMPQDMRLFSGTLRENLLLGLPDPGDDAILEAARRTGLIDLINSQSKGLALEITEGGRGVSGGQKQLISLTRMLIAKPKIWLLDEPTGAMDSITEAKIVTMLAEEANTGATLLVATHKTALLPLFDRLVVMHSNRIMMDGPRDQVLAKLSGKPPVEKNEVAG